MGLPDSVLGAIKLSPKYLLPLFLAATVLLFAPLVALERLGAAVLVQEYRMWIGLTWLVAGALLLSHVLFATYEHARGRLESKRFKARGTKYLSSLTPQEKAILAHYIAEETRSQNLDFESGVTNGLVHHGIIYRASSIGSLFDGFAYNIQPWAWEVLNQSPHLLEPELTQLRSELSIPVSPYSY